MGEFNYDNERDRHSNGFDAGVIVDGEVRKDPDTGEIVLVDEDGKAFSSQRVLEGLIGKKVRLTCISFDAMDDVKAMVERAGGSNN